MKKSNDHSAAWSKVVHYLIVVLAFMIPLYKKAVPGLIALTGLALILRLLLEKKKPSYWIGWPLFFLLILYALHVVGLSYSENPQFGQNELMIKLSLFVFPLYMLLSSSISPWQTEYIERSFTLGTFCFAVVSLIYGLFRWQMTGDVSFLSYDKLSIYFHPSYMATYVALSIYFLLRDESAGVMFFGKRWLHAMLVLFLLLYGAMLASKAGFIAIVMVVVYHLWVHRKQAHGLVHAVKLPLLRLFFFMAVVYLHPVSSGRVAALTQSESQAGKGSDELPGAHSSTALRKVVWSTSCQLILSSPFGTGTGDADSALVESYRRQGEEYAAYRHLNTHNQWLQYGVELGWPGMVIFSAALFTFWLVSRKKRSSEGILLAALLGMNMLFESFFEVQAGVVFGCFWIWIYSASRPATLHGKTEKDWVTRMDHKRDRV